MDGSRVLERYYRTRVGDPADRDEVYGYWGAVLGVWLALLGVAVFVGGDVAAGGPAFGIRQVAIGLLLFAGPTIGLGLVTLLPLRRLAVWLARGGLAVCAVAVALFAASYPAQFNVDGVNDTAPIVLLIYAVGLSLQALPIALHPILADGASTTDATAERSSGTRK